MNWSAGAAALVRAGVVTVTSTIPAAWAGLTAVICVSETMVKLVAAVVPKLTEVTPVNPDPLTVTVVPPAMDPEFGLTPVTDGGGAKGPTVNDHVYGSELTVRATVYVTPFSRATLGIKTTPPRKLRLVPTLGLRESRTQFSNRVPGALLPTMVWTGPAVVATLPPTWMKTGNPVGSVYPAHGPWSGSGDSPPPYVVSGSVLPFPGKYTGYAPPVRGLPWRTSREAPICQ